MCLFPEDDVAHTLPFPLSGCVGLLPADCLVSCHLGLELELELELVMSSFKCLVYVPHNMSQELSILVSALPSSLTIG